MGPIVCSTGRSSHTFRNRASTALRLSNRMAKPVHRAGSPTRQGPARAASVDRHVGVQTPGVDAGTSGGKLLAGKEVVVVGGGPGGMMAAISAARHGANVRVYELREQDYSTGANTWIIVLNGRGCRGFEAAGIDVDNIPHSLRHAGNTAFRPDGTSVFVQGFRERKPGEDKDGQSVPRMAGTRALLTAFTQEQALRLHPRNILLRFGCKLVAADLNARRLEFEDTASGDTFTVEADLIVGADGANSFVRTLMTQQVPGFSVDVHPNHTSMLGVQLPRLPGPDDLSSLGKPLQFAPDCGPNDSWIGKGWMVTFFLPKVATFPQGFISHFPDPDKNCTAVLGMPDTWWAGPRTAAAVRALLQERYPQLPEVSLQALVEAAAAPNPRLRSTPPSIKCSSLSAPGVLLVGDAAHSVSPMYGQGTQSALEDSVHFYDAVERAGGDIAALCRAYNESRLEDVRALADLDAWFNDSTPDAPGSAVLKWIIATPFKANTLLCRITKSLPSALRPLPFNQRLNFGRQSFSQIKANTRRDLAVVALLFVAALALGLGAARALLGL